jgi:ribosomal protein S18 acetylase RimI-like enzyme
VTHFRPFRNGDPPALAELWNRGLPSYGAARPLSAHEFDLRVTNQPYFEAGGLIVAERDGKIVGFVHAGFGPDLPAGRPLQLTTELGAIVMLVVEPPAEEPALDQALIAEAERYLRRRGASVIYAGGQTPVNPFYWGLYGGSEYAGILSSHQSFQQAVVQAGYEEVSTTVLLEADLALPEGREPRAPLIRRMARIQIIEDALPRDWWEALAIGEARPTRFQLLAKADDTLLARVSTWDMPWFGREDRISRLGLVDMEVPPQHRRKGYGRHLVGEILRQAREAMLQAVTVQTSETNIPALALYESLGFQRVETATLYRLPGHLTARSLGS